MPVVYQVVGFGRGTAATRVEQSRVLGIHGSGVELSVISEWWRRIATANSDDELSPDYSTLKTYSCRNLYETCMSNIQKLIKISAEVLYQAITDTKNGQHYKYTTLLHVYVVRQNGRREK